MRTDLITPGVDYVATSGNHPQVYIGAGSHATFFWSSTFLQAWFKGQWKRAYINPMPNSASLIDSTTPLRRQEPVVCEIAPLNYDAARWKGYWGDHNWDGGLDKYNTGPPSPAYRKDDWGIRIFSNPNLWHNKYTRIDVSGYVDQPFVILP